MTQNCILCGEDTSGSVGASGIKWATICQLCKDAEDQALESALVARAQSPAMPTCMDCGKYPATHRSGLCTRCYVFNKC